MSSNEYRGGLVMIGSLVGTVALALIVSGGEPRGNIRSIREVEIGQERYLLVEQQGRGKVTYIRQSDGTYTNAQDALTTSLDERVKKAETKEKK